MLINLPQTDFKQPMSDVFLHRVDSLSQLLGNCLTTKWFHVEVVRPRRENQERDNRNFAVLWLHSYQQTVQFSSARVYLQLN